MSIEVHQLTKVFQNQIAVDQVSFSANKGEILGFLGPNGAGKSTTMKMICGYLKPTSGSVSICNIDISENALEAKKKIGYLPETNPLYKDMYIREYLHFFGKLTHVPDRARRVEELIEITGLTKEQNKKIGSLSKGYRQRVGLSQALLHDPEVLVLDEPTTGLDPNQIIEIRQLIRNIGKHKTMLFSTHIMQEVQALCDRVVILHKGTIVADENIQSLMNRVQGNRIIAVEFASSVNIRELQGIPRVKQVKQSEPGKFQLFSDPEDDIRDELFKLSSTNQWTIRELKEEKSSMEEVFNELTKTDY